jgi:hypothetical protein
MGEAGTQHRAGPGSEARDGGAHVREIGEDGVTAFTEDGIENLKQIIADLRAESSYNYLAAAPGLAICRLIAQMKAESSPSKPHP